MGNLKPNEFYEAHADFCSTCGNAKRLKILDVLSSGESYTVSELAEQTEIAQSTLSQHLKLMRDRDVLSRTRDGVNNYYRVKDERIIEALQIIQQVLEDRLEK